MHSPRYINLNLFTLKYPLTAITSLMHRISGVFVFLMIPLLLWFLDKAMGSQSGFDQIKGYMAFGFNRFVLWLTLIALGYHLIAGIRHLIMDLGFLERLNEARLTAVLTFILSIIWAILLGIWLW